MNYYLSTMICHATFNGRMPQITRSALAQKNMSPQFNFKNNKRTPHRSVTPPMTWISTQSARQRLNCHEGWRMTKNMKTTKNNEKEASGAKKEYQIKRFISKQMVLECPLYCHIENVLFVFFKPTHPLKTSQWRFTW